MDDYALKLVARHRHRLHSRDECADDLTDENVALLFLTAADPKDVAEEAARQRFGLVSGEDFALEDVSHYPTFSSRVPCGRCIAAAMDARPDLPPSRHWEEINMVGAVHAFHLPGVGISKWTTWLGGCPSCGTVYYAVRMDSVSLKGGLSVMARAFGR